MSSDLVPQPPVSRRELAAQRATAQRRRRGGAVTATIGVFGDLFLTAGVLVLAFLGWQLFLNNDIQGASLTGEADQASQQWDTAPGLPKEVGTVPKGDGQSSADVPVFQDAVSYNQQFANLIVPKFGADFFRPIGEGTDAAALSRWGVGHYEGSALPGEIGNLALASHRDIDGAAFRDLDLLDVGDSIYVETQDGWYKYLFRSEETVTPTTVSVLDDVPHMPGAAPDLRYLTMTTCTPKWTSTERLIAYAVFDSFTPRSEGAPAEIAGIYQKGA